MIIRNKFNGYSADNRRLYNMGGAPSATYSNTSNIPEYAQPYVDRMMQATEKQIYKTDAAGNPIGFQQYKPYEGETVAGFSPMQASAMRGIQNYQLPGQTGDASNLAGYAGLNSMMAGQNYQSMATDPNSTAAYMSPYIQNALNPMMDEARRQSDITGAQNAGQAVGAGAFGGSRFGIQEASRQNDLGRLQNQIYGQGMQSAFQNAQQAQQFGSTLGLQGYGQALQGANTLGQLGQQQYGQEMGLLGQQAAVGKQQQDYEQSRLNQLIQNYATEQQYPFIQLGTLSNMLRGLPMQASTTQLYQAQPSMASQMAGGIGTGLGLYQQYQKAFPNGKEGGVVKGMANGGITNPYKLSGIAKKLSDPQLAEEVKDDPMGVMQAEEERRKELRGMANGGIIAFAGKGRSDVEDKEDRDRIEAEKNKQADTMMYAVPEGTTSNRPITNKTLFNPNEGADEVTRNYYKQKDKELNEIRSEGNRILAKRDIDETNKGIRGNLGNISPVREGVAANDGEDKYATHLTPYLSNQAGMSADNQGITAAPSGPSYRDREAANLEAGLSAAGQRPTPLDPSQQALLGLTQDIEKEKGELKPKMDQSTADLVKSYEKDRKDAGLPDIFQVEKQKHEDRKTRGEKSEQETARNNLIRFLTRWGTIPGGAMRGMIGAGAELVDKMDLDAKHRDKFLNELDDIESKINSSEYARRLGDEERARKEKEEAGKRYYQLAHDLNKTRLDIALKDKDLQRALEVQFEKNQAALAKTANTPAIIQEVNIKSAELMQKYSAQLRDGLMSKEQIAAEALDYVLARQPQVTSTAMTLPSRAASAGADVTRAETDAQKAERERKTARGNQVKQFQDQLRVVTMTGEVQEEIQKAKAQDKTGKKAKEIIDREARRLLGGYELLTPQDVGLSTPRVTPVAPVAPAAAPAKAAEPKKTEPKKDEGKPAPAKAAEPKKAEPKKPSIQEVDGAPAGSSLGNYVQGKGWEVKGKNGKLIGYAPQ